MGPGLWQFLHTILTCLTFSVLCAEKQSKQKDMMRSLRYHSGFMITYQPLYQMFLGDSSFFSSSSYFIHVRDPGLHCYHLVGHAIIESCGITIASWKNVNCFKGSTNFSVRLCFTCFFGAAHPERITPTITGRVLQVSVLSFLS